MNKLCVSPCNCGPNAECKVIGHYPMCYCKPGYSGNPQISCVKGNCQQFLLSYLMKLLLNVCVESMKVTSIFFSKCNFVIIRLFYFFQFQLNANQTSSARMTRLVTTATA